MRREDEHLPPQTRMKEATRGQNAGSNQTAAEAGVYVYRQENGPVLVPPASDRVSPHPPNGWHVTLPRTGPPAPRQQTGSGCPDPENLSPVATSASRAGGGRRGAATKSARNITAAAGQRPRTGTAGVSGTGCRGREKAGHRVESSPGAHGSDLGNTLTLAPALPPPHYPPSAP